MMKPLKKGVPIPPKWTSWCADVMKRTGLPPDQLRKIYEEEYLAGETWLNHLYVVIVKPLTGGGTHLSIRRQDRAPCRDWRHFQQIKNQLCGPEREALELYPAESRVVDTANQFHLWVMPENVPIPIGWTTRCVLGPDESPIPGAVQRRLTPQDES
jgi:hypothetical protein